MQTGDNVGKMGPSVVSLSQVISQLWEILIKISNYLFQQS